MTPGAKGQDPVCTCTKMNEYIATFYTHASALLSSRTLTANKIPNRIMPVPRSLSSSCGVCIRYSSDQCRIELMDEELEAVYLVGEKTCEAVYRTDESESEEQEL